MRGARSKAVRIASSHLITSCATIAAILLFVGLGSQVLPSAMGVRLVETDSTLKVAFLLNIAIILFGWRRSKDLKDALDAYEEAERIAQRNVNTDPTTGLANRRELMRSLSEALEAKSGGVLLLLDLDHFKRVNDTYGHAAGDTVLRSVGGLLLAHTRGEDIACRYGGEEFTLILPDSSLEDTWKRAEQLRKAVKQLCVRYGDQSLDAVTISVGVASFPEHGATPEAVLRAADIALYQAKADGRDRVVRQTTA